MPEVPLLWRACLAGDVQSMTDMIDRGTDLHQKDRNGESCVHMTARSGEVKAIEMLIERGLDVNHFNHNGQTPLHIAVSKDNLEVVRFIVENQGDMDIATKFSGMTALHVACKEESVDMVRVLIDNGANCAIKDKIGQYPDFYAYNLKILAIFDTHFDTCTHGRGRRHGTGDNTPTATSMDDTDHGRFKGEDANEDGKKKKKKSKGKDRDKPEYNDIVHGEVEIYDKMEKYDQDRAKQRWDTLKHQGKKLKINHDVDFSEEHKKRMQQNVFDRLMAGGKKKS